MEEGLENGSIIKKEQGGHVELIMKQMEMMRKVRWMIMNISGTLSSLHPAL